MIYQFGPWRPDGGSWVAGDHLVDAQNVVPYRGYYGPFRDLSQLHPITLTGTPRGVWTGEDQFDSIVSFVGDGNQIFQLSQSTRTDVSKPGGYSLGANCRWRTVEFAGDVIATAYDEPIQAFNLRTLGTYDDLDSAAPRAEYIAVVGDYLMVGNIVDAVDGVRPDRVAWSGFGDARDWDTTGVGGAGQKTIFDLGPVTGLTGGQVGIILCRRGLVRVEQIGSGLGGSPFAFRTITDRVGCEIPGTVVKFERWTYFYSKAGWVRTDGYQIERIGVDFIDEWFRANVDRSKPQHFWAVADDRRDTILFSAPTTVQLTDEGDLNMARILLVHRPTVQESRWSYARKATRCLGRAQSFFQSSDDIDDLISSIPDLSDDFASDTAEELTAAVSATSAVSTFTGEPLEALIETGAVASQQGARYALGEFEVFHDGGDASLSIGTAENAGGNVSWTPYFERLSDGRYRYQLAGRHIRARARITGAWERINGVEADGRISGRR